MSAVDVLAVDWYERRDELCGGMVFRTREGFTVELDHTVPGDATKWRVLEYYNGSWFHEEGTIEPGDLVGQPTTRDALARVGGGA